MGLNPQENAHFVHFRTNFYGITYFTDLQRSHILFERSPACPTCGRAGPPARRRRGRNSAHCALPRRSCAPQGPAAPRAARAHGGNILQFKTSKSGGFNEKMEVLSLKMEVLRGNGSFKETVKGLTEN